MINLGSIDVVGILEREVKLFGSQRKLAKHIGISPPYLSDILLGNRKPGKTVLDYLGLEKIVVYIYRKAK